MGKVDKQQIIKRLALAESIARAARLLTLPAYKMGVRPRNKSQGGTYDPVTQVDIDTEILLRGLIMDAVPNDGIEGEEHAEKLGSNDWLWTLDPIDGTRAFVAGVPVWSTLIAVSYQGRPLIGIIDLPALDETYVGAYGKAWKQTVSGRAAIKTSACRSLNDAILSCTAPLSMFTPSQFQAYRDINEQVRFSRLGLDAYGYALVASGRIDIVLEADIKPYDIRAIIPIVEGAGGCIQTWDEHPANDGGSIICTANEMLLNTVVTRLGNITTNDDK